jgi:choline dehydrogenase
MSELGVSLLDDPNAGVSAGAMIVPSTMSAQNQSRSDSRTAYLDGILNDRPNLHLASEQTVTRILTGTDSTSPNIDVPPFGRLRRAYGVEVRTALQFPS